MALYPSREYVHIGTHTLLYCSTPYIPLYGTPKVRILYTAAAPHYSPPPTLFINLIAPPTSSRLVPLTHVNNIFVKSPSLPPLLHFHDPTRHHRRHTVWFQATLSTVSVCYDYYWPVVTCRHLHFLLVQNTIVMVTSMGTSMVASSDWKASQPRQWPR